VLPGIRSATIGAALVCGLVTAGAAAAAPTAHRTVRYHGVAVTIPAAWPVIDLASHPRECVRFNRHALYLGSPSTVQQCPASMIGRTEAILLAPSWHRATLGAAPGPGLAPGYSTQFMLPRAGVRVIATWAAHPAIVASALGRRLVATGPARPDASALPVAATRSVVLREAGVQSSSPLGVDACSAPSVAVMQAWLASPYRTIGVYIGGVNSACAQPNLTAAWVQSVTAQGWRLIPTYVGLQAAGACGCAAISPATARSQGVQAANDAVAHAKILGIPPGNPIYDDMEGYGRSTATTGAVLAFVSGWTSQLHTAGYTAGVYSSGGSGITDLVNSIGTTVSEPDELWIANWNGLKTASDPYVPAAAWSSHQRLRQYSGSHNETYGHVTINVDSDYIDGPTASGVGFPPPDGSFVSYGSRTFRMAGGAPLLVTDWRTVGGLQGALALTATQWRNLRRMPRDGTLLTAGGSVYEVVGGAPLAVTSWAAIGGQRAAVAVDPWDLANAGAPMAHLGRYPLDGTFVTAGPGGPVFRLAGDAPFAVTSWVPFGGPRPAVVVDVWNLLHPANPRARIVARPRNGTLVSAVRAGSYWRFNGGFRTKVIPAAGAVQVDDASLAAYPPVPVCIVPAMRGMTVRQARSALVAGRCQLGVVRRTGTAWKRRTPHVVAQGAPAGARRRNGTAVGITIR
jgi:hypothetical protein